MEFIEHFITGKNLIGWVVTGAASVFVGYKVAKWNGNRSLRLIRKGNCPDCKARKSLRITPISGASVMLTCSTCAGQWLVENVDGEEIVHGPADQFALPSIRMRVLPDGSHVFETDAGIAIFRIQDMDISTRRVALSCRTPRERLSFLYRTGQAPDKIELSIQHHGMVWIEHSTEYQYFAASAGLDIAYLGGKTT